MNLKKNPSALSKYWQQGIGLFQDDIAEEKRSLDRVTFSTPVSYRVVQPHKSPWFRTQTLEISDAGLRLLSKYQLLIGSEMEMHLKLPKSDKTSKIKGQIAWVKEKKMQSGEMFFEAGVKFENLKQVSNKSKMFALIAENLADFAAKKTSSISARPANNIEDIESAFKLLYQEYLKRGYCDENAACMHYNHFVFVPGSQTFIYQAEAQTVGSVSLLVDSPCGLPMESTFRKEIQNARKPGVLLSEVGLLSVDGNLLGRKRFSLFNFRKYQVVFELFGAMLFHAVKVKATDLVIAVHPKHLALYEYLGFNPIGKERTYSDGKPAVPMKLNIEAFIKRMETSKMGGLYRAISDHQIQNPAQPVWNLELVRSFLVEKKNIWESLCEKDRAFLGICYPGLVESLSDEDRGF